MVETGEDEGVGVAIYFATYKGRVEKILPKDRTKSPNNATPLPDPDTRPGGGLVFELSD